jgi:prolyl oligopeptidase
VLDSIPGRAIIERRLSEVTGAVDRAGIVQRAGSEQLIFVKAKAGDSKLSIWTRPVVGGAERLVDAKGLGSDQAIADEWVVSPDGRHLLYGIDEGGRELADYFILDIESGRRLPDRIVRTFTIDSPTLHWLSDGSGFFYTEFAAGREMGRANSLEDSIVRFHRLGTDQAVDPVVCGRSGAAPVSLRPAEIPMVVTAPGSSWALLAIVDGTGPFVRLYAGRAREAATGHALWSEITSYADQIRHYALAGERIALLSASGTPRGRVLVGPVSPLHRGQLAELPLGDVIPERLAAARDALYVQTMDGGYGGVKRAAWNGAVTDVPLPFEGGLFSISATPVHDGAFIDLAGWVQPFAPRHYDPATGRTENLGLARFPFDLSGYEAVRTFATARDGTRVPISLAMKRGLRRDGSNTS